MEKNQENLCHKKAAKLPGVYKKKTVEKKLTYTESWRTESRIK